MTRTFTYSATPARIVFGAGTLASVGDEIKRLGGTSALIVSTPNQAEDAERLARQIGPLSAGTFPGAQMHTPVEVTRTAIAAFSDAGADCVVSIGGGSTIGLGKAISFETGAPHLSVATTYAGSEVTDILGQTEGGRKTTKRDPKIRPATVIYDPELTVGLPVPMSVASGLNAMAHAVEALYAEDANPVTSLMAVEGLRALRDALPGVVAKPEDISARSEALYGSWLCGTVLGAVGMSLHHKLCHTLGGTFDLPHAETHAILLPHTANYNAPAAAEALRPAAELFGGEIGPGLYAFAQKIGAPMALSDLGVTPDNLETAATMALENPYWNPREITRDGILALLQDAHAGRAPTSV